MAKWSSGKQETFLDVTQLKPQKKVVRPVAEQERYESRRLWRSVTAGLKDNRQVLANTLPDNFVTMSTLGLRRQLRKSAN